MLAFMYTHRFYLRSKEFAEILFPYPENHKKKSVSVTASGRNMSYYSELGSYEVWYGAFESNQTFPSAFS